MAPWAGKGLRSSSSGGGCGEWRLYGGWFPLEYDHIRNTRMQATRRYSKRFAEIEARVCELEADVNAMAGFCIESETFWLLMSLR